MLTGRPFTGLSASVKIMTEMVKGDPMSDETKGEKPKSYITKLQEENEELKKKLVEIEASKPVEVVPVDDGTPDDRKEMVEVTYGVGQISFENDRCHWKEQMTKEDALNTLYNFYIRRKANQRMIPREGMDGDMVVNVNDATCYTKFTKTDVTGKILHSYKDMPLWLAAERKVNHPRYVIELVKKSEYQKFYDEKAKKEIETEMELLQMFKQRQALYTLGK